MAHPLIPPAWLALAVLAAPASAADGGPMPDPTRPPAVAATGAPAASGTLVLQSVLFAPDRRVAVISGMPMVEGDRVHGHRLVAIGRDQATLDGPDGPVRLQLYPAVVPGAVKFNDAPPMKPAWQQRRRSRS